MAPSQTVQKASCGGLTPWQADVVLRLLRSDLCADVSVEKLARLCGLSRSHFTRAFKASVGAPPHQWLLQQRVRRAGEMLEWTDESISAIALSCGFADQSHLTRMFHATVGASPAAWRRQRRAEVAPVMGAVTAGSGRLEARPEASRNQLRV